MNYNFQFSGVFAAWPLLLKSTWNTIELSVLAMMLGLSYFARMRYVILPQGAASMAPQSRSVLCNDNSGTP